LQNLQVICKQDASAGQQHPSNQAVLHWEWQLKGTVSDLAGLAKLPRSQLGPAIESCPAAEQGSEYKGKC
jgi:hypothetical protein